MDFDFGRDLIHSHRRVLVEVALDRAARVDRNFVVHHRAQAFDDAAADLIFGVDRIDDLAADIAGRPDLVDLQFIVLTYAELDHFREITPMRELESDAHAGVLGESALAPSGLFRDKLEDALHARSVEIHVAGIGRGRFAGDARSGEKIQAELDGIFTRGVSELVSEGLKNPGVGVAAGSAQSVGGDAERHEGGPEKKVLEKGAGKLIGGDAGGGSELLAFAETDEVIAPGDESPGGVQAAFEKMKTGGAIVIVVKIVLASPEEFDGNADLLGDSAGFEHVVVGETAAESTAGTLHVNDDVVVGNIENLGDEQAAIFRCLAGRPEFKFAVVIMGETVFRLHGGVREEWIGVSGLNGF